MKKLRLDVDELHVDSFVTRQESEDRGTVEGFVSARCTMGHTTCVGGATCDGVGATCSPNYTCYLSCAGSCPCEPPDTITEIACEGIETVSPNTCAPCVPTAKFYTCQQLATCDGLAPCN